jgi:hypothetical protein
MPMATCHHPAKMVFFMSPTLHRLLQIIIH